MVRLAIIIIYVRCRDATIFYFQGFYYLGKEITNNAAEYQGLIEGLKQGIKLKIDNLIIQGDSQLILRQVEGLYKVKNENDTRVSFMLFIDKSE